MKKIFLLILLTIITKTAYSDILSENWYKVTSANVHIGYLVTRYEYLPKPKQFRITTFMSTIGEGGAITESLKATSTKGFKPIKYQYTSIVSGVSKVIDAVVKKGILYATLTQGPKISNIQTKLKKGSFLSSFLPLIMLSKGITKGVNFKYKAVAEEEAKEAIGKAYIKEVKNYKGLQSYRVLNDFKRYRFISYLTEEGIPIATKSPRLGISTEIVPTKEAAAGNHKLQLQIIKTLFGNIPGPKNTKSKVLKMNQPKATGKGNINPGKLLQTKPKTK